MVSEKLVRDIMRPAGLYPIIDESDRIDRALRLVAEAQEEGGRPLLIVVGICETEEKVIKGYVTPSEVVFGIARHFLKGAANSGAVFWNGQLESECSDALQRRVGEIAAPFATYFGGTESLMEAVFRLDRHRVGFVPVVQREEMVGIVHLADILKEIAEMTRDTGGARPEAA